MLKLIYEYYQNKLKEDQTVNTITCAVFYVHVYFWGDLGWFCHSVLALIVLLMKVKDNKGQVWTEWQNHQRWNRLRNTHGQVSVFYLFFLQQAKIWGIFSNLYCYRMLSFLASARLMSLGCLWLNESPVAQAISSGE